jgi:hypothetical protein
MTSESSRDLKVFALKSQLRQTKGELKRAERDLIVERLEHTEYVQKVRVLLLRSFRVVTQARRWVDANAFGEGDTDLAWLSLYQSICDWDMTIQDQLTDEDEEER